MDLEYYILSNLKINEIIDQNFEINSQQNVEKVIKDKGVEYENINNRIVRNRINIYIIYYII
jgi:hypothetical protein